MHSFLCIITGGCVGERINGDGIGMVFFKIENANAMWREGLLIGMN